MLKKSLPFIVSALIMLAAGYAATWIMGYRLAPPPDEVLAALSSLLFSGQLVRELSITVARSLAGLALALFCGSALGFAAGLSATAMRLLAPLTAAVQTCPPVVWISLLAIWAGTGSVVPVTVVFVTTAPIIFSNTAHGVHAVDARLRAMSAFYNVPWSRRIRSLFIPAITPYWLAGLSIALATAWKTAAVAEFLSSHQGVGARIFWSYHELNMHNLFAWAVALMVLGVGLECGLIAPLRRKAGPKAEGGKLAGGD